MSEESVTTTDGPARVERSVTVKGEGVIVELSVTADAPATVRVTDDLPAAVGPDQVGFHPDHTPETGEATAECVAFEAEVTPDDPLTIVYGAYLDTTGLEVDWETPALRLNADPLAAAGPAASSDTSGGGSSGTSDSGLRGAVSRFLGGGGDEEPDTARTESSGIEELEDFDDPEPAVVEAADGDEPDDADGPLQPAIRELEDEGAAADEADEEGDTDDDTALDLADPTDAEDADDDPADPDEAVDADADDDDGDADALDDHAEEATEDETDDTATPAAAGVAGGSVAAALAAELEAGEVDEATRERLAEELGATLSGSQTARLDHVQRRVDDLAAYVTPLEELLDEEGPPVEVVADLREEAAAAREERDALADRVDEATAEVREAVNDLDARLDEVAAEAEAERAALETEVEGVADEVAAAREELDAELDALRETLTAELERVEAEAREERGDLAADVAELETVAAQVRSMREALSSAFGMDTSVEGPDTETETEPAAAEEGADEDGEAEAVDAEPERAVEQVADGGDSSDIESRLREMESDEDEPEREKPF
ncbi:hypothetical protein [Halosegnis marinus]|uniref:Uncharacterized protein n=1 Tax=Halosegnis marinus TaxID=3034023 RepID=A0ABD5ZN39_9EURY|nr:hypothetical protein [Halosegnis sp. DT85]